MNFAKVSFFIALLLTTIELSAQETYSRVAIGFRSRVVHHENADSDIPKGISLDFAHGFPLSSSRPLFLEAGANLAWTHYVYSREPDAWSRLTARMNFLDVSIPVDFVCRFSLLNGKVLLAPSTGPNFRFNLIGKQKNSYKGAYYVNRKTEKINFLARDEFDPASIFQFGWRLGLALCSGPFYIGYAFTYDFTPYCDVRHDGPSSSYNFNDYGENKTAHHSLSVGYTF